MGTTNSNDCAFKVGDHIGIYPANRKEITDAILKFLTNRLDPDKPIRIDVMKENHTLTGTFRKSVVIN